jgi:hypothetical protein
LLDDKVPAAAMLQAPHHGHAFARMRVMRVSDHNVKPLFLGSMSPSRRDRYLSSNCTRSALG